MARIVQAGPPRPGVLFAALTHRANLVQRERLPVPPQADLRRQRGTWGRALHQDHQQQNDRRQQHQQKHGQRGVEDHLDGSVPRKGRLKFRETDVGGVGAPRGWRHGLHTIPQLGQIRVDRSNEGPSGPRLIAQPAGATASQGSVHHKRSNHTCMKAGHRLIEPGSGKKFNISFLIRLRVFRKANEPFLFPFSSFRGNKVLYRPRARGGR